MLIFDRIRLQDLERRTWQLWTLAIVMILILAGGLALHMYTLASGAEVQLSRRAMLEGMISFCLLAILFTWYLVDRLSVIASLRRVLEEERKYNLERRKRGSRELLRTLSGPDRFSDRLALEVQRAARIELPLSGLTIALDVSSDIADSDEVYSAFGEAVKAMISKLRAEDSIYQFSSGVYGILLPGAGAEVLRGIAVRIAAGLNEAMGLSKRYSFDIQSTTFPDQAKTDREMELMMLASAKSPEICK